MRRYDAAHTQGAVKLSRASGAIKRRVLLFKEGRKVLAIESLKHDVDAGTAGAACAPQAWRAAGHRAWAG